uniref:Uncharacterized protein n=1 Tax=Rhodnius prolixus TaxID=13249 RepID=T1IBB2_RHOPR
MTTLQFFCTSSWVTNAHLHK